MFGFGKKPSAQAGGQEPARKVEPVLVRSRRSIRPHGRSFAGAKNDRLTAGWSAPNISMNEAIRRSLRMLRMRSNQLARDDDYMKNFLRLVPRNVIGPKGIALQGRIKLANGKADDAANVLIEEAWRKWGKIGVCTVDGALSWLDLQKVCLTGLPRDGEFLILKLFGVDNPFGFALQLLSPALLDETYERELPNGNRICMSIEIDRAGKRVAYHIRTRHPGDNSYSLGPTGQAYVRIPADRIIHGFLTEEVDQLRGVPWVHTAARRMNMLGGYEEAELVAARAASSKMGFYKEPIFDPETDTGHADDTEGDGDDGDLLEEFEPGVFGRLPPGVEFEGFDPQHPTQQFADFVKTILRGVASGLGVSYHSLTGDLEKANYSSLRQGALEDREAWRTLQTWTVEHLHEQVFADWLKSALIYGGLSASILDEARFSTVQWVPRGWDWVDPQKEIRAMRDGVALGIVSRTQLAAEKGRDISDTFDELAAEEERAKDKGINIDAHRSTAQPAVAVAPEQKE